MDQQVHILFTDENDEDHEYDISKEEIKNSDLISNILAVTNDNNTIPIKFGTSNEIFKYCLDYCRNMLFEGDIIKQFGFQKVVNIIKLSNYLIIDTLYKKCCELLALTWIKNVDVNVMKETCILNDGEIIDDTFYDIIKYITIADYENLITLDCFSKFSQCFKTINKNKALNCTIMFIENANNVKLNTKCNDGIAKWCIKKNYLSYLKMLNDAHCIDKPKKLFGLCCEYGNIEIAKWLLSAFTCVKIYDKYDRFGTSKYINTCCENGKLDMIKWIYEYYVAKKITKMFNLKQIFSVSCRYNQLACAQWIYSLDNTVFGSAIVRYQAWYNELYICCENGFIDLAKWLYSINNIRDIKDIFNRCFRKNIIEWLLTLDDSINIHDDGNCVFKNIGCRGDLETAKWFYSLDPIGNFDIGNVFDGTLRFKKFDIAKWIYSLGGIDANVKKNENIKHIFSYGSLDIVKWFIRLCDNTDTTYITNNFIIIRENTEHRNEILEFLINNYNIDIYELDCELFKGATNEFRNYILSLYDTNEHYENIYMSCCRYPVRSVIEHLIKSGKISKELFMRGLVVMSEDDVGMIVSSVADSKIEYVRDIYDDTFKKCFNNNNLERCGKNEMSY
jgi:hypothetical protein